MKRLLLVLLVGCGDLRLDLFPSIDATTDAPNPEASIESGADGGCLALEQSCASSDACCSGLCKIDPTARITCRPTTGCLGAGKTCTYAGACCSVKCDRTCAPSGWCARIGETCTTSSDCCSDVCMGGKCAPAGPGCKPAGESCMMGECCGGACTEGDIETGFRCALLQACRAEGEICKKPEDCCSGQCGMEPSGTSRCKKLPGCASNDGTMCTRQIGEPCKSEQECCSHLCTPTGDGVKRCATAGGCRLECELCETKDQCCSGACTNGRCAPMGNCGGAGEACSKSGDCCNGATCVGSNGVLRCQPNMACSNSVCAYTAQCCTGACRPGPDLQCRTGCANLGAACSAHDDCCGTFSDCLRLDGKIQCVGLIR